MARLLAGDTRFDAILSLAGRTSAPSAQPLAMRSGGFGGVGGLVRYLREHGTNAVIDATHPYADQMSAHAVAACRQCDVPLVSLVRAPWQAQPGDRWRIVPDTQAAVGALGAPPQRVFLSLGRQELQAFAGAPQHLYLARVIDPPDPAGLPAGLRFIQARGPFDLPAERRLLAEERIDVVISKNAGGAATYPKIEAARALGLPVIMIDRPYKPSGHVVHGAGEALDWLARHVAASRRGV